MPKKKNYVHNYLCSFKMETWELMQNYIKAYPHTSDGLKNSINKLVHDCVERKVGLPKMKKQVKQILDIEDGN